MTNINGGFPPLYKKTKSLKKKTYTFSKYIKKDKINKDKINKDKINKDLIVIKY